MFNSYLSAEFHPEYSGVQLRLGVVQLTHGSTRLIYTVSIILVNTSNVVYSIY